MHLCFVFWGHAVWSLVLQLSIMCCMIYRSEQCCVGVLLSALSVSLPVSLSCWQRISLQLENLCSHLCGWQWASTFLIVNTFKLINWPCTVCVIWVIKNIQWILYVYVTLCTCFRWVSHKLHLMSFFWSFSVVGENYHIGTFSYKDLSFSQLSTHTVAAYSRVKRLWVFVGTVRLWNSCGTVNMSWGCREW